MKTKVIRLNETQIEILKIYLEDCNYYIVHDHYAAIDKSKKAINKLITNELQKILEKLNK